MAALTGLWHVVKLIQTAKNRLFFAQSAQNNFIHENIYIYVLVFMCILMYVSVCVC